jgi:hypothetical protein
MRFEAFLLEDVTEGILRGLDGDDARKRELIARMVPRFLRETVNRFAGVSRGDSGERAKFASGHKAYIAAVLLKPSPADANEARKNRRDLRASESTA